MKKLLYLLLVLPLFAAGQNYIKTTTYKQATATSIASPTADQALQTVTYSDGLGRPIQQVGVQQSGTGKNIVLPMAYDALGRQQKQYLPYVSQGSTAAYETTALTDVLNYPAYSGQNPYAEKLYEASPANRVLKQSAPGNSTNWAMGAGHEIKYDYQTNTATEVKLFRATATWDFTDGLYKASFTDAGTATYAAGQLYKTVLRDENMTDTGEGPEEFKDKQGRIVLKRAHGISYRESGGICNLHDTYYVYDQYGNLSFVIPPKVDQSNVNTVLDDLCYQYRYDDQNRLVAKKLPGKQWEYILYDRLGRIVGTGPANSPFPDGGLAPGWLVNKYDMYDRPIYTGWYNGYAVTAATRKTIQTVLLDTATVLSETKTATPSIIDGVQVSYTNGAFPTTGYYPLTVQYYDNYVFPNAPTVPTTVESQTVLANVKTLPTGSWVRVLTSTTRYEGETSYTFYDNKARPIRNYNTNYLGGYLYTDSKLDFAGKTLYTISRQKRRSGDVEITIRDDYSYTAQDRLLQHTHRVNNNPIELLSLNSYDELGQLMSKKVGRSALLPLQKVDYSYNIRGWLTGINNVADLIQGSDPADLFAFRINYDIREGIVPALQRYDGNIGETSWKTATDNTKRSYSYGYDELNRLNVAYYQKNGGEGSYDEATMYDSNNNLLALVRYGELDSQNQTIVIDDLEYTYNAGNRLRKVTDHSAHPAGFKDGVNSGDDYVYDAYGNMTRDFNKGINTDITYNHLNLPLKITTGNPNPNIGTITYLYNALGQKVNKSVTTSTGSSIIDYLGGFQYANGELNYFPTSEGYVRYTPPTSGGTTGYFSYVYNYTDHLGNVRLSYAQNPQNPNSVVVLEENNYYAFGMKHAKYNEGRFYHTPSASGPVLTTIPSVLALSSTVIPDNYRYNGKEWQDDLGLNMYDYGARNYDSAIGRWMNVDPLAEIAYNNSPYNYTDSDPVNNTDPDGRYTNHSAEAYGFANALKQFEEEGARDNELTQKYEEDQIIGGLLGYHLDPIELRAGGSGSWAAEIENHVYGDSPYYSDTIKAGAQEMFVGAALLSNGWAADAIDPEPISKVVGAVVMVGITAAVVYQNRAAIANSAEVLYNKMTAEINRIAEKAAGPQGFQYALTATKSGLYPNVRGGFTFLNIGDVWKYGETTSNDRYTRNYLTSMELNITPQFYGNRMEIKIQEKIMIYAYYAENLSLPPGNKIFR